MVKIIDSDTMQGKTRGRLEVWGRKGEKRRHKDNNHRIQTQTEVGRREMEEKSVSSSIVGE